MFPSKPAQGKASLDGLTGECGNKKQNETASPLS